MNLHLVPSPVALSRSQRPRFVQFPENQIHAGSPLSLFNHARYDAFGQVAAEYSTAPNPAPCSTCYLVTDVLGSTRLVTDQNAAPVTRHDFVPFGEEIPANTAGRDSTWGSTTDVTQKFTGQVRDQETGLDYFNARYYAPALGRFTSPDPGNAGADPSNPQSWNAYAYVNNNPLNAIDPSGMDTVCISYTTTDSNGTVTFHQSCSENPYDASSPSGHFGCVAYGTEGCITAPSTSSGPTGGGGGAPAPKQPTPAPAPAKTGTKACANGIGSGGFGIGGGYNLDLAAIFAGLSSTGGIGGGLFHNRAGGAISGYSAGGFASGGAAAYAGSRVAGAPKQSSSTVFAFGAYAGAGANIFFTNAASVKQLAGPFTTISANGGLAEANFGLQVSFGGGIWQVAITPPMASVGFGFAASAITTNTLTTNAGCN